MSLGIILALISAGDCNGVCGYRFNQGGRYVRPRPAWACSARTPPSSVSCWVLGAAARHAGSVRLHRCLLHHAQRRNFRRPEYGHHHHHGLAVHRRVPAHRHRRPDLRHRPGRAAVAGISLLARRSSEFSKAMVSTTLVEIYALLAFLVSLLSVLAINGMAG